MFADLKQDTSGQREIQIETLPNLCQSMRLRFYIM